MQINADVLAWYFDQVSADIAVIISIGLFLIISRKMHLTQLKYATSLKSWVYIWYFSLIFFLVVWAFYLVILPLAGKNANQIKVCKICNVLSILSGCFYHVGLFNLLLERLHISFKTTVFEISSKLNIICRCIYNLIWVIIAIIVMYLIDPSPYNIYTRQVDYSGNGITCSLFAKGKVTTKMMICLGMTGLIIMTGNIFIWALFMHKLKKLMVANKTCKDLNANDDLIILMKEQTTVVALAVTSTILLYMLQMMNVLGQFFVTLDFIITPIIVFCSFKFNRYWFEKFKCNKMAKCCCSIFERQFVGLKRTVDERNIAEIISHNSNSQPPSMASHPSASAMSTTEQRGI